MRYKFIDNITSDVLFEAYGKTLKEVFENAAQAMFTIICKTKQIKKKNMITVEVTAEDEKDLLYNWLQELIAQVDIEEMFFSSFNIIKMSKTSLKAELYGEPITKEKGETVVKAVTNYKFALERLPLKKANLEKRQKPFDKIKQGYKAVISLDI